MCYAYIHNTKKLDAKGKKGYFLSYDRDSPAYLVYFPETNSVMKHRIVKFTDSFEKVPQDFNEDLSVDVGLIRNEKEETEVGNVTQTIQNPDPEAQDIRPQRTKQPPSHLKDYVTKAASSDTTKCVDFCYVINIPSSFDAAINSEDAEHWKDAMDEEMKVLDENDTYILSELPRNKKAVGGRWVYTVKGEPDNVLYKARYVAKGCSQIYGVNYIETFSPTARMESLRLLMYVAAQYKLSVHQMDMKGAYLHAPIECEIYVNQPAGYKQLADDGKALVWKLNKSLYGLKQSGRNWHTVFHDFLLTLNFIQSSADACVYVKNHDEELFFILVWVDDIILATKHDKIMENVKEKFKGRFKMKDLGPISYFLGIQFSQMDGVITITQSSYLRNILNKFGMADCKPRATPSEMKPSSYDSEKTGDSSDELKYREIIGSLVYAMTCTRLDLSYIVTKLSQHLSCPDNGDWILLKHVFQYIQGTLDFKLSFHKNDKDIKVVAYCDADWASSLDERRSITGHLFMVSDEGPAISWKSKKQASVALSTCEAEYMALSSTCQEVSYLTRFLENIMHADFRPVEIRSDNQGAIALVKNPVKHHKSKHIDIRYHFIRNYLKEDKISLSYVPSDKNVADIFTKPCSKFKLQDFKTQLFGK